MKKIIIGVSIIIFCTQLNSQEFTYIDLSGVGADEAIIYPDKIIHLFDNEPFYEELTRDHYFVNNYGFNQLNINKNQYLYIDGKYFDQLFYKFNIDGTNFFKSEKATLFEDNIEKITSSKFLIEKNGFDINMYPPINLFRHYDSGCKCHYYGWKNGAAPFVIPSDENYKKSFIDIKFKSEVLAISILNGFIDPNNIKLYKYNSRVKLLKVIDLQNTKEYLLDFDDMVYFNDLYFDNKTNHIRIEIIDIYQGEKSKDICLSAIIPHEKIFEWDKTEYVNNSINSLKK